MERGEEIGKQIRRGGGREERKRRERGDKEERKRKEMIGESEESEIGSGRGENRER